MRYVLASGLVFLLTGVTAVGQDSKTVNPDWIHYAQSGVTLSGLASFKPFKLDTQQDFDALWDLYKPAGEKPSIDFEKQLVVTYEAVGQWGKVGYRLSDNGEFRFAEEKEKPTKANGVMLYWIVVVDRAKVKSFNSTPLQVDKVGEKESKSEK